MGADEKLGDNTAMTGDDLRDVIKLLDELRFRTQLKSANCRTYSKPRSKTWATLVVAEANTAHHAR